MPPPGGGGAKKGGKLRLPSNGCLRYAVLYLIALVLLIGGLIGTSGGLLSRFGLPATDSSDEATITLNSANPAANNAAPQPGNEGSAANLPANAGGSAPSGEIAAGNTESGNAADSPRSITGNPVASNQAGIITPYLSPAFYIVQAGDSLGTIALTYGTTAAQLQSYNRLASAEVFIGQVIYLPPQSFQPVPGTGRNSGSDDNP